MTAASQASRKGDRALPAEGTAPAVHDGEPEPPRAQPELFTTAWSLARASPAQLRLRPFQQGALDGLCGVYAIVNVCRLALARSGHPVSDRASRQLFHRLVASADLKGARCATTVGLTLGPLTRLLQASVLQLAEEQGCLLRMRRPFRSLPRLPCHTILLRMARLSDMPCSAILIGLGGFMEHWTVIASIRPRSIMLFDSAATSRIGIAHCRMSYETELPGREHVIYRSAVFHIIAGDRA